MEITVVGPPTMIPIDIEKMGVKVDYNLIRAICDVDVIMMLRIQLERQNQILFPSLREYSNLYGLTLKKLNQVRPDVLIIHPGPVNRGIEISLDVQNSAHSLILNQVTNGIAVRMALMYLLLGGSDETFN